MNAQNAQNFMGLIVAFFNHPFFIVVGGIATVIMISGFLYTVWVVVSGVFPVWYRLGMGLSKRRVAIFASLERFEEIKTLLVDSSIFKEKNIVHITLNTIDKAKGQTIFLVDWETFKDQIDRVFSCTKNHQTAVVIYAKPGSILPEKMNDIANRQNTVVVNFKGRLLNDILTSLITTSYECA